MAELRHDLSRATKAAAAPPPPPPDEWRQLLCSSGLEVRRVETPPPRLLTLRGLLADEGLWRSLIILTRLARHADARSRVLHTWTVHRRHRHTLSAILIVAEKPAQAA